MRRPTSLTLRLTLLFCAAAAVVFLITGWVIGRAVQDHFAAEDGKELQVIAEAVEQSLATLAADRDLTRMEQRFDDILVGHHTAMLQIVDAAGRRLYATPGPDLGAIPRPAGEGHGRGEVRTWSDGRHHYRVLVHPVPAALPIGAGPYTVTIAVGTDYHREFMVRFRETLWLMVVFGIAAMGAMGWIAVRHGHRPLRHMVERIGRISASQLDTRLDPGAVPVELTELAVSFNGLLQRLEEAFDRLSNFSADIAHELRTPITNLMTQTQVALSQARGSAEYQEILYSNIEEYERMAQMIGDMLFLAQADNDLNPPPAVDVDLGAEIRELFDYYEAWAEERRVGLTLAGAAHVRGDRLMLRRALSNLLANAIRHTPAGQATSVRLEALGDAVEITVENPGTPIPAEHLPRLFDRFYRVDPSRRRDGQGAGLGLAIVRSIVQVHGGRIGGTSDARATCFRIRLPAPPISSPATAP